MNNDDNSNTIFSYSRKQAIEDGVLIEVPTEIQELMGFKYPLVVTDSVHNRLDKKKISLEFQRLLIALKMEMVASTFFRTIIGKPSSSFRLSLDYLVADLSFE